jgi:hypothetical protein
MDEGLLEVGRIAALSCYDVRTVGPDEEPMWSRAPSNMRNKAIAQIKPV